MKTKLFFILFFLVVSVATSHAVEATANPNPYNITMEQIEFYDSLTGAWITVAASSLPVDIASVNAGSVVAAYVTNNPIPESTYTRIRVSVNREMSIKASYADTGNIFGGGVVTYYTTSTSTDPGTGRVIVTSNNSGNYATGTSDVPSNEVQVVGDRWIGTYDFSSPLIVQQGSTQTVTVFFDVSGAATFSDDGGAGVIAYQTEPSVTVTVSE